ncbi:MAG TPA: tRNA preQ1(34) S-adenosylmethionine ribosyltransferase-isomerase QueA [Deltaproteobacteria bacterium]|nr:tRNA preQ1(34) S-adenosylmethionine ribosyltransferase-isomerase QueA [Deltaproteobacteria bacterium]
MRIEEFDYTLPKELIAQHPEDERASSRLLVLNREKRTVEHRYFKDVKDYFRPGDVLVLNDTRVFPARIAAVKPTGGRVEILMVEELTRTTWSCLAKGLKKGVVEQEIKVGTVSATVRYAGDTWEISFPEEVNVRDVLDKYGRMPLPPYIKREKNGYDSSDFDRYQTVYAERLGSIAAPTAGLHFTGELLRDLTEQGVIIANITLHIGIGTFFLIKKETVEDHQMHREWYNIERGTAEAIQTARAAGGRVIAVGTSAVRTLETFFSKGDGAESGYSDLFIYPGYRFKAVDILLTNFHLPRSTPLLLTSAFAGKENLLSSYAVAIEKGYRFYSYGDAMLIQ